MLNTHNDAFAQASGAKYNADQPRYDLIAPI
jgi:hypothetical protein